MKFFRITGNIAPTIIEQCQEKLTNLMLDLALRENNEFTGSGLGGNELQFTTLVAMQHHLENSMLACGTNNNNNPNNLSWGSKSLTKISSIKSLRLVLNDIFPVIKDVVKLTSIQNNWRDKTIIDSIKDDFSQINKVFSGRPFIDKNISSAQKLAVASIICSKLANELDNNNLNNISSVGQILSSFDPYIFLFSVRKYIGIERLVRYNLDEIPSWKPTFSLIHNRLNK